MKFCTECGQKSDETSTFCENCGTPFGDEKNSSSSTATNLHSTSIQPVQLPAKKMSKKQKIGGTIAGLAILLLIVAHLVLSSVYDPVKKVQAMNEAYNSQDKPALLQQFALKKGAVASPENFYSIVNNYGWTDLRNQLMIEAEHVKTKQPTDLIYHHGEFISVNPKPKVFGLYQDAEFRIIPTEVSIEVPYKNIKLKFDKQEVTSQQDDEIIVIGDYLPGEYTWSYEYPDGPVPLSGSSTYDLNGHEESKQLITPDWNFTAIELSSDIEDAIVYINDQSTKKTIAELQKIHPVQLDPTLKIHAVFTDKEGKAHTSETVAGDSTSIYLPFQYVEQQQELKNNEETVKNIYKNFRDDYANSIYYADFDYIQNYFKDGTKIKQDYAKFVYDHRNIPGYKYDFLLNDITAFKTISETKFELHSLETFDFVSDKEQKVFYERKKKYTISKIGDDYYIDGIEDLDTKKTIY